MAFDLTLTTPVFNAAGKFGQSLSGGYGRVTPTPLPTSGTFTIECWAKTTDTSAVNVAFGNNKACWLGHVSGKAQARYGSTSEAILATTVVINDGLWHHLALCVDGAGGKFFVDGVLAASNAATTAGAGAVYTEVLEVRTFQAGAFNWLGEIDECAITSIVKYTAAFTPAAIADSATSLVVIYHLEGIGTNTVGAVAATPAPVFATPGQFGGCMASGFINAPNYLLPQNGLFTVEAWVKTTETVRRVAVGQAFAFWLGMDANGLAAAFYGNGPGIEAQMISSVVINNGAWHHLALTLDATGGKLFVDGVMVSSNVSTFFERQGQLSNILEIGRFTQTATYAWTGGIDEVAIWVGARYLSSFSVPTAPYAGTETNLVIVYHLENSTGIPGPAIPLNYNTSAIRWLPTNEAVFYSGSWLVTDAVAKTINSGQYFRTVVPAGSCGLNFDLTGIGSPLPQITIRVNGKIAIRQEIAAQVSVPIDTTVSTQGYNLVEVFVAATTETVSRWTTQVAAVLFQGFSTSSLVPLRKSIIRPRRVKIYGDSITEGVRVLAGTAPSGKDTDRNDALGGWALALMNYLGAEVDVVGFGGTGISDRAGSGGVPNLIQTYGFLWSGQPRNFAANPSDLVIFMEGTNDPAPLIDITTTYTAMLNQALTLEGAATKFLALQPFNGTHAVDIPNAVAACSTPARVTYKPSTGFWATADSSDNLHPYAFANLAFIAPKVGTLANQILGGVSAPAPATIPTGSLPIGKCLFKFVGTVADNISNYSGLGIIWALPDGGDWTSGAPGVSPQAVSQFLPGRKYYVFNSSAAAIPLYGAQL